MKKTTMNLALIGMLMAGANTGFAQDAPPVNADNSTTVNQMDNSTADVAPEPESTDVNSTESANTVNAESNADIND